VESIVSVASFFLSRIDVLTDPLLEHVMAAGGAKAELAATFRGETAIASAKGAYALYRKIFDGDDFQRLADKGAHPQRLLWASTSTKNPAYSNVKYVESLIGPNTIITMPNETLEAYAKNGKPAARLSRKLTEARRVLEGLSLLGISLDDLTQQLEDDGVRKFANAYDLSIQQLEEKRNSLLRLHDRATAV